MYLPDGRWVLGPGDSSPEIRAIKAYMRKMFRSYAGHLADTELYDQEMYLAVLEMQQRYAKTRSGIMVNGFIGASTKELMGYWKPKPPARPQLHTVCGTGVRGDDPRDPTAHTGRYLQDTLKVCDWWWVGYEAKPFPMWGSILGGVNQLITDIAQRSQPGTPIWACGFSQGASVWSLVYKYHMLPVDGILHNRLGDLKRAFMFCNPSREEGVGGTPGAGALEAQNRLVDTPLFWREYAHPKDIYASVPVGPGWGENIRAITKIIMGNNWWAGQDDIFEQLLEIGVNPFSEGWNAFQSLMKAGLFFGSGTGPHVQNLPVAAAIDYLRS